MKSKLIQMRILARLALLAWAWLWLAAEPVKAPNFNLESTAGARYSLASVAGKIVFITFFQEGCKHCEEEAPALNALAKRYPKELQVLGVGYQTRDRVKLKSVAAKMKLGFPALVDTENLAGKFGVWALPHGVLVDEDGLVVRHYQGVQISQLQADIQAQVARLKAKGLGRKISVLPLAGATDAAKQAGLPKLATAAIKNGLRQKGLLLAGPGESPDLLLEGSVSKSGPIVGVSVTLKQAKTGEALGTFSKTVTGQDFSPVVEALSARISALP